MSTSVTCRPDKFGPSFDVAVGNRIELHPGLDRWMMGDRFGTVLSIGTLIRVRLERSGDIISIAPDRVGRKL